MPIDFSTLPKALGQRVLITNWSGKQYVGTLVGVNKRKEQVTFKELRPGVDSKNWWLGKNSQRSFLCKNLKDFKVLSSKEEEAYWNAPLAKKKEEGEAKLKRVAQYLNGNYNFVKSCLSGLTDEKGVVDTKKFVKHELTEKHNLKVAAFKIHIIEFFFLSVVSSNSAEGLATIDGICQATKKYLREHSMSGRSLSVPKTDLCSAEREAMLDIYNLMEQLLDGQTKTG